MTTKVTFGFTADMADDAFERADQIGATKTARGAFEQAMGALGYGGKFEMTTRRPKVEAKAEGPALRAVGE